MLQFRGVLLHCLGVAHPSDAADMECGGSKTDATLDGARQIAATLPLPHLAAREAYYAAYHAAEACIFEQTGKVATTHPGVRSEFGRLARREPRIDRELARFLATAYQLKATADYAVGPAIAPISAEQAAAAIGTPRRSIDTVIRLLPPGITPPCGRGVQP
jgi:uncharacterized protein (UPF0332 family)